MRHAPLFSTLLLLACGAPPAAPSDAGEPDGGAFVDAWSGDDDAGSADAALPTDAAAPRVWRYRDIGGGIFPSLAIGDDGTIHVGHTRVFTNGTGQVLHSRSTGGRFETAVVAEGPRLGWNVALALAGTEPRIVYSDPTAFSDGTGQIYLAQRGSGAWGVAPLPLMDSSFFPIALACSGDDSALAYAARAPAFARSDVGPWASEALAAVAVADVALAFDAAGDPHVAYISDGTAMYGKRLAGGWAVVAVDSASMGYSVDLALGPDGRPFVAYSVDGAPWVAERTDAGWLRTEVATGTDLFDVAIAVDAEGVVHVAFADGTTREVLHASSEDGGEPFVVASTGTAPSFIDLALDPDGRPHIAFTVAAAESTLRLASR